MYKELGVHVDKESMKETSSSLYFFTTPLAGLTLFFGITGSIVVFHVRRLFLDSHGWSHRASGGLLFLWLIYGIYLIQQGVHCQTGPSSNYSVRWLNYDVILGTLGLCTTVTAAKDFPHRYIQNASGQSGTLSQQAMVTQSEMIEHVFYQFLNLWQALYLHGMATLMGSSFQNTRSHWLYPCRWIALLLVTAPWLWRRYFPVHSFSENWNRKTALVHEPATMETFLYRIKKAQYLFYKHVVLHGVNLTVFSDPSSLVTTKEWRLFWICLNTSYVMEFFLQSLVKRHILQQATMLSLNRILMVVSSLAAVRAVVGVVSWPQCALSLLLNLLHRGHDLLHTMVLAILFV